MGARISFRLGVIACGSVLLSGVDGRVSEAHPHVWITNVTTFVFEDRVLVGVRHRWRFDDFFSSFVIQEHDADGDGAFDDDELESLRAAAFASLEEYGYFTHLRVEGDLASLDRVEDFAATIEDGVLVYEFTLRLPEPVDPASQDLALGAYDEEFYVEVLLDPEDPVRFAGLPDGACIFDIREDVHHPIYYGMVYPRVVGLSCANS